eukprot:4194172-Prymnesium_polylepis.1
MCPTADQGGAPSAPHSRKGGGAIDAADGPIGKHDHLIPGHLRPLYPLWHGATRGGGDSPGFVPSQSRSRRSDVIRL